MYQTKTVTAAAELKADSEGSISAVFSTFDVVDSQGDIVVREAFTDGQPVPMVWSHDWSRPIGKGTVRTDPKRAIFDGQFFLETTDGLDAYRTVKSMGALQEFSWGFKILDAAEEVRDGVPIRVITKAEVFEVSPVLVGANRETYTLSIKGRRRISRSHIEGAIAALSALLADDDAEEIEADDPPADDGKSGDDQNVIQVAHAGLTLSADGERLAAELAAFTAHLKDAGAADRATARAWATDIAARMTATRHVLDAVLRRAEEEAELDTASLFRVVDMLDVRYGAIEGGLVR